MKKPGAWPGLCNDCNLSSVGLTPQEGGNLDPFLIGAHVLLVVIRGDRRLVPGGRALGGFGVTAGHPADQTTDAKARAGLGGGLGRGLRRRGAGRSGGCCRALRGSGY